MAELLIKAIDSRMPTVEEWRQQLLSYVIPKSQEFFEKWPDGEIVNKQKRIVKSLQAAISILEATSKEDKTDALLTVSRYQSNPLTKQDINRLNLYTRLTHPSTGDPLPSGAEMEHYGLPLIHQHNYYKHQIEVESVKSDKEKEVELCAQDKAGCAKKGDIIVVMPTGHLWGKEEGPPTFIAITVEDFEHGDLKYLAETHPGFKRRWSIDITNLSHGQTIKLSDLTELITDKVGS